MIPARREELQRRRRTRGLTQEGLGERVGVNDRAIRAWEAGTATPYPSQRPALAEALGLDTDDLERLLTTARVSEQPTTNTGSDSGEPEQLRIRLDASLSTTVPAARLDMVEQTVRDHLTAYTRTGPAEALAALVPDLDELHTLAERRHPIRVQRTLCTAVTMLTLLVADGFMKQGKIIGARRWYATALLAAHDGDDPVLAALVLAQRTMLAYYYETPQQTVATAREARDLAADTVCDAAALAAAAEARALGRLGDAAGVRQALADAHRLTDLLAEQRVTTDPHAAYHFHHGRLALYASGAWSNLGDTAAARHAQDHALRTYAADPGLVIDPALIRLDRAVTETGAGDPVGGAGLAVSALTELQPAHRTAVVLTRARDVITVAETLPRTRGGREIMEHLRELTAS